MLKLYIAYPENGRFVDDAEYGTPSEDLLKRFDETKQSKKHKGREMIGMWVIDEATENEDVIRKFGRVPHEMAIRYNAPKTSKYQIKDWDLV